MTAIPRDLSRCEFVRLIGQETASLTKSQPLQEQQDAYKVDSRHHGCRIEC